MPTHSPQNTFCIPKTHKKFTKFTINMQLRWKIKNSTILMSTKSVIWSKIIKDFSLWFLLYHARPWEVQDHGILQNVMTRNRGTVFPIHTMMAYKGSRGTALLILNLSTRYKWIVNFTPQLLNPHPPPKKISHIPTKQEAQWAPEPVWTFWRKKRTLMTRNAHNFQ
jgi:hypothetical protein